MVKTNLKDHLCAYRENPNIIDEYVSCNVQTHQITVKEFYTNASIILDSPSSWDYDQPSSFAPEMTNGASEHWVRQYIGYRHTK